MVLVRFDDSRTEKRALALLVKQFSFTSWKTGETLVPDAALLMLAEEGIVFKVASQMPGVPTARHLRFGDASSQ